MWGVSLHGCIIMKFHLFSKIQLFWLLFSSFIGASIINHEIKELWGILSMALGEFCVIIEANATLQSSLHLCKG